MKAFKGLQFGEGRISKKEGKSLKGIGIKGAQGEAQATQTKFLLHLFIWEPPLR